MQSEREANGPQGGATFGLAECEEAKEWLLELIAAYLERAAEAMEVHAAAQETREQIRQADLDGDSLPDQEVADLNDLLAELTDATSFEHGHRDAVGLVKTILENDLGNADESEAWAALVRLRGPIEALWRYECNECEFTFPVCGMGAYVELFNGGCEACGAIGFFRVSDEGLAELQHRYDQEYGEGWSGDPRREAEFWEEVSEALPRCACGTPYAFSSNAVSEAP